jgi:hypothetical protein
LEVTVVVVFESSVEGAVHADEELEDKQKRKVMSLLEKVEVLDKLDRGTRNSTVGRRYDVNKSIIHFIKKKRRQVQDSWGSVFMKGSYML